METSSSHSMSFARERLEKVVSNGMAKAGPVVERLLNRVPQDAIVRGKGMTFEVGDDGRVRVAADGFSERPVHEHAFGQLADRAGIPTPYATSLAEGGAWKRDLLRHTLNEHYAHSAKRFLVRSVDDEVRGFLSDSYRRLDTRPLLDAFIGACTELQAVPFEGVASDVRASVRAIVPVIHEPVPGEALVFGLDWHNSDFGAGLYGISAFVLRLICINGAVGASSLKQVHLGSRLPDDLVFSNETYAKDTETMTLATRDVVKAVLSPGVIEKKLAIVRAAAAVELDAQSALRSVSKALTKAETKAVEDAFNGPDTLNLPEGKTAWRFSNALSWVANSTDNPERKLELQALAGKAIAAEPTR